MISVPSGAATETMVNQLAEMLEPGDVIIDTGNSNFHDSQRRAAAVGAKGLGWLDFGVSGGIWGLQVGFCTMIGGERALFDRLEPIVRTPNHDVICFASQRVSTRHPKLVAALVSSKGSLTCRAFPRHRRRLA